MKYFEEDEEFVGGYLIIRKQDDKLWLIENKDPELLGHLEKIRVGAWMSWCLTLEDGCYLSAGCMDEVREVMKQLNAQNTVNKNHSQQTKPRVGEGGSTPLSSNNSFRDKPADTNIKNKGEKQ